MSDQTHALEDLRLVESEERYRAVIDNSSDMIQSIRPNGTFEFVNQAWRTRMGYTDEEVQDLTIWEIVHPDSVDHCQTLFVRAVQGAPIEYMQAIFTTKDGQPVPVEGSVTSRFIGDKVVATHGFFRDISERLRAQELEERNTQLEREQQARYLEKMAALGKLSAGLAHELNNPAAAAQRASSRLAESLANRDTALWELTGIGLGVDELGALNDVLTKVEPTGGEGSSLDPLEMSDRETSVEEWLEDHNIDEAWNMTAGLVTEGITEDHLESLAAQLPAEALTAAIAWITETLTVRELTDVIVRSSHRISELVSAVKGYSYMDRGTEQRADVHDGLESTLIILGHQLTDVTIKRKYDRSLPLIDVFGNTLNQVWTNILDNAIDATDGKGTIAITTSQVDSNVVVEIEDNGSGIAPADLACIFEPFFTTKPQGEGTGLGLDTAWRIVTEEHGGMITVESEPGHTVFKVTVPVEKTRSKASPPAPAN